MSRRVLPDTIEIKFSDHAIERWRQRISPHFRRREAEAILGDCRLATKSERRRGTYHNKGSDRRSTVNDRRSWLVNDDHGLLFIVCWDGPELIVKTVWKLEGERDGEG